MSEERQEAASFGRRFLVLFDDAAERLAKLGLSAHAYQLAFLLMKRLDATTWRMLTQADIGSELDLSTATISRALRDLVRANFLERRGLNPRTEYRLCAMCAWRGTAGRYHKAVRELEERQDDRSLRDSDFGPGVVPIESGKQRRLPLGKGRHRATKVRVT